MIKRTLEGLEWPIDRKINRDLRNWPQKNKRTVRTMNDVEFVKRCKNLVADYTNKHLDKTDGKAITSADVYVVWQVKALQNSKALLSTTLSDGMYYEVTYNGDKSQLYLDAYKKFENVEINL